MKINIIGRGNVASQFVKKFNTIPKLKILHWYSRSFEKKVDKNGIKRTNNLKDLKNADINFLMVSDDVVKKISKKITNKTFTVHLSGIHNLEELNNKGGKGVFYPIQTFSKKKDVKFKNLPICIESDTKSNFLKLKNLIKLLEAKPVLMNSNNRKYLHLSATIVNNFTNHLYTNAKDICIKNNIPFVLFKNLINETTSNALSLSPRKSQTGAAKRNDRETINKHLELLKNNSFKKVYKTLTESIIKYYEN
tara:strand:+ start:434 stop:1183 length:750 start_codon:yes stop_codon:yes gene_type:complete